MELKEIFKHDENKVFHELANAGARYRQLRERFVTFVEHFPADKGTTLANNADFDPQPDVPALKVAFCGRRYEFRFAMVERKGLVRCLIATDHDDDWEELGRFTFNGQGIAEVGLDALEIHHPATAYGIVAAFLTAGADKRG